MLYVTKYFELQSMQRIDPSSKNLTQIQFIDNQSLKILFNIMLLLFEQRSKNEGISKGLNEGISEGLKDILSQIYLKFTTK